jgi:hypothetical protein
MLSMLQIHFPVMAGRGMGFGLPIDEAVQRTEELAKDLSTAAKNNPASSTSFGRKIAQSVKSKVAAHTGVRTAAVTAEDESFGQKIKEAVEKKRGKLPTQKQHKEEAERDGGRYRPLQPREPTKSD